MANTGRDSQTVAICELHFRQMCASSVASGQVGTCECLHVNMPYLWQVCSSPNAWISLPAQSEELESAYCRALDSHQIEVSTSGSDGTVKHWQMLVNFEAMTSQAVLCRPHNSTQVLTMAVRRLSTPSYCTSLTPAARTDRYLTQWRWYYEDGSTWYPFAEDKQLPTQYTLEQKYLSGQEVYRFKRSVGGDNQMTEFLIDFNNLFIVNLDDGVKRAHRLRRRPQHISHKQLAMGLFLLSPHYNKPLPYSTSVPKDWVPLEPLQKFEMVPLNPESVRHHLVVSEMKKTMSSFEVFDVFAIQNPYMWHRFESKRLHMQHHAGTGAIKTGKSTKSATSQPLELQLFHGTPTATAAEAILSQGFDPRLSGKHAVVYGDGCYFAADASLSDRYTSVDDLSYSKVKSSDSNNTHWMFMARVLVGRYTQGSKGLRRPPPLDPAQPHADFYDSCVDNMVKPKIYVVFDSEQCYPEYLVSYTRKSN